MEIEDLSFLIKDLQSKEIGELFQLISENISSEYDEHDELYRYNLSLSCACISNERLLSTYNILKNLIADISYRVTAKERYIALELERQVYQIKEFICNHPNTEKIIRGEILEVELIIQMILSITSQCELEINLAALWVIFFIKIGLSDLCDCNS